MNDQQMTFNMNLLELVTPYTGLLALNHNLFQCSDALAKLLKLSDPRDFESFKAKLSYSLRDTNELSKTIELVMNHKSEQRLNVELEHLNTTVYFAISIKSFSIEDTEYVSFQFEDQTRTRRERQAFERLTWLSEQLIRQTTNHYLSRDEICDAACKLSILLIGKSDMGSFVKLEHGYLSWPTLVGYELIESKMEPLKFEDSLQWMLSKDAPDEILRIDDLNDVPEILPLMLQHKSKVYTRSMLSAPIHDNGQIIGYINVDSTETKCFTDYDLMLFKQFIFGVGLAIEKSELINKLKDFEKRDLQTGLKSLPAAELRIYELLNDESKKLNFGLVLADLMGLSTINDRYGWNVGNEAILATSRQLSMIDTVNQEVYRLSSDQYLLIVTKEEDFASVCDNLALNLRKFYTDGASISGGRMHIPVVCVSEYIKSDYGSLREILGHLRQKMKLEKAIWRLKMPIF